MALRTHFEQTKIGCPGVAEFTVQRTEALFDYITGLRQIAVTLRLIFRQRTVAVGFAHNAVRQPMFFQMLPVFLTIVSFVGIDGRTFGNAFQQRRQVVALMGIGGSDVQFLDSCLTVASQASAISRKVGLRSVSSARLEWGKNSAYTFYFKKLDQSVCRYLRTSKKY